MGRDGGKFTEFIVIESANYGCHCHLTVTAVRKEDSRARAFLYVRAPLSINFGDTLLAPYAPPGHPVKSDEFWLDRGPGLRYHLLLDDLPHVILTQLLVNDMDDLESGKCGIF